MKNLFIILLGYISSICFCNAQQFHAGIKSGLSTTQVDGDQLGGYNKAGIVAGAFVKRKFAEKISVQFEIIYFQKGSRKPLNVDDNTFYLMRLNYMEVPVLFHYQLSKKVIAEAGVAYGALVFSEEEDALGIFTRRPEFNKTELSANAGIDYSLSENWSANVRASYSILPVRNLYPGIEYSYFNKGQFNNVLAFSLYYTF